MAAKNNSSIKFAIFSAISIVLFCGTILAFWKFTAGLVPFETAIIRLVSGTAVLALLFTALYFIKQLPHRYWKAFFCTVIVALVAEQLLMQFLELICFVLCHETFDFEFYQNFNVRTLKEWSMIRPYLPELLLFVFISTVYFTAALYAALMKIPTRSGSSRIPAVIGVSGMVLGLMVTFCPCSSTYYFMLMEKSVSDRQIEYNYQPGESDIAAMRLAGYHYPMLEESEIYAEPGRNIVFIQLESMNLDFLNEEIYPGLCPELRKAYYDDTAVRFPQFQSSAGNTYLALFQARVGMIYPQNYFPSSATGLSNSRIYALPRLLKLAGYDTEYIQTAASLTFCNKGMMLADMGYDRVYSLADPKFKAYENDGAGSCDHRLFDVAYDEYLRLAKQGKPFYLSLLSYDGHNPIGIQDAKTLRYAGGRYDDDLLLNSQHTTDHYLGIFLDKLRRTPYYKDTLIVICNDHSLRSHKPSGNNPKLELPMSKTLLCFALNADTRHRGENTFPGHTYDIAPTIIDLAQVKTNYYFPLGVSPFQRGDLPPNGKLTPGATERFFAANSYVHHTSVNDGNITLHYQPHFRDREIVIGDERLPSTYSNSSHIMPPDGCAELFVFDLNGKLIGHKDIATKDFSALRHSNEQYVILTGMNANLPKDLGLPESNPADYIFAFVDKNGKCRYALLPNAGKKSGGTLVIPQR